MGQLVWATLDCTITTIGTGAGSVTVTLPFTPTNALMQSLNGYESAVTGKAIRAALGGSATVTILDYTGAAIIGNLYRFTLTGLYQL